MIDAPQYARCIYISRWRDFIFQEWWACEVHRPNPGLQSRRSTVAKQKLLAGRGILQRAQFLDFSAAGARVPWNYIPARGAFRARDEARYCYTVGLALSAAGGKQPVKREPTCDMREHTPSIFDIDQNASNTGQTQVKTSTERGSRLKMKIARSGRKNVFARLVLREINLCGYFCRAENGKNKFCGDVRTGNLQLYCQLLLSSKNCLCSFLYTL